ncbi:hypothetical protein [Caulobacter sp. DWR2-3-1b2]|uniref:hypothetical protein n=1 Tax=unclassified Caulobacter TaxID=2648921 RepID=UPI0019B8D7F9|nr:hypothetical protein [Caulobacter sp.]
MTEETSRKRIQLRWLTLAEIVGVGALVIAGLGFWDSHRERERDERDRVAAVSERRAEAKAQARKLTFVMTGAVADKGETVRLNSVNSEQVIQTQTIWFPAELRSDSVETTGNPRLEAGWIENGLRKHAGKARTGRVPVGVLTVFIEDGQTKTDRAVYQLGYSLHDRTLRADKVELEGLSLARRNVSGDLQAAAGSLWSAR